MPTAQPAGQAPEAQPPNKRRRVGLTKSNRFTTLHPGARDTRAPATKDGFEDVNAAPESSSPPDSSAPEEAVEKLARNGASPKAASSAKVHSAGARQNEDGESPFSSMVPKKKFKMATYGSRTLGRGKATPTSPTKAAPRPTGRSHDAKADSTPSGRTSKEPRKSPLEAAKPRFKMPNRISTPVLTPPAKPKFSMRAPVERARPEPPTFHMPEPGRVEPARSEPATFRMPPAVAKAAREFLPSADLFTLGGASSPGTQPSSSEPHDLNITSSNTTASLSLSADRLLSPDDLPTSICPICAAPVAPDTLIPLAATLAAVRPTERFTHQAAFCRAHREASARLAWQEHGYPTIDWAAFPSRLEPHRARMLGILAGNETSHSRLRLEAQLSTRREKGESAAGRQTLAKEFANHGDGAESVGYYGGKGTGMMLHWLVRSLAGELRGAMRKESLVRECGSVSAFVQRVLLPELAAGLVVEDMRVAAMASKAEDETFASGGQCTTKATSTTNKKQRGGKKRNKATQNTAVSTSRELVSPTDAELAAARERLEESADLGRLLCPEEDDDIVAEDDSEVEVLSAEEPGWSEEEEDGDNEDRDGDGDEVIDVG